MFRSVPLLILLSFFCGVSVVTAAMTSTSYRIDWDSLNTGGSELATSTNFGIYDTMGEVGVGSSTSTSYELRAGYRAEDSSQRLLIESGVQDGTSTPVTSYTAFDAVAKTVTVTDPADISAGDMYFVIEHQGFAQKIAFGEVSTVAGNVVSFDRFSGDQGTMQSSPTGGNNYLYRVVSSNLTLGVLSTTTETTLSTGIMIQSEARGGYSLYLQGTGLLQDTSGNTIATVSDGEVTLGSEEYGVSMTGDHAVGGGTDLGVTTTPRLIMTAISPTDVGGDRSVATAKVAISGSTPPGNYSQTIYYVLVPRY
jgi:hypothetical protein